MKSYFLFWMLPLSTPSFEAEKERLTHHRLVELSSVCKRWRGLCLTPTFWSRIELDSVLWSDGEGTADRHPMDKSEARRITGDLLELRLKRTTTTTIPHQPLHIMVVGPYHAPPLPKRLFRLLCDTAYRWETACFICTLPKVPSTLSAPLLKALELNTPQANLLRTLTLTAPLLSSVVLTGSALRAVQSLPAEQLYNGATILDIRPDQLAMVVSFAGRLPSSASFRLRLFLEPNTPTPTPAATVVSKVGYLNLGLVGDVAQSSLIMGTTFAALVLPRLRSLQFHVGEFDVGCLGWPQAEFVRLCSRSQWEHSLAVLDLAHVLVTEQHLLELIPLLPRLEILSIADILSDRLIIALRMPALPHLWKFTSISAFTFDKSIFADWIGSRQKACDARSVTFYWHLHPATSALEWHLDVIRETLDTATSFVE
ncbi:hypothetical protein C8F04DRAFT_269338 [Mycena alexandri]|uniref:F-box domain-containing protein n=1 Tax=Mycena alexandri TaxID=1745969 RepID=A0AAD6S5T2_9AGAR|nr:hypothetical protein C8F04DRAFT_269338 [Mycena alexandri]